MLYSVALMGGTFDPIHNAHIRIALELKQQLALDEVRLLPCFQPPHRQQPMADSAHRLNMLKLALQDIPELSWDDCEYRRQGISYSVDTVAAIRHEMGNDVSLSLVMGADAFLHFCHWKNWRRILQLTHLIILPRPGYKLPAGGEEEAVYAKHKAVSANELKAIAFGKICLQTVTPLDVTATSVRERIIASQDISGLVPGKVSDYILKRGLYL